MNKADMRRELSKIIVTGAVQLREAAEDEELFLKLGSDRTSDYRPDFDTFVSPGSIEELSQLVRYCFRNRIGIVPSGGRTGYAGGAVAINDEIVVSMRLMANEGTKLDDSAFDDLMPSITVPAGTLTKTVHELAQERNLFFPVDFASSDESQIGGNIATNAGGIRVIRYGSFRDWVLGLKVVTGTGDILEFRGEVLKDNTGYDLKQLWIGSEGTLGIIAEATLRLTRPWGRSTLVLFGVPSFREVLEILRVSRKSIISILAYEFFDSRCVGYVRDWVREERNRSHFERGIFDTSPPYYALLEIERHCDHDRKIIDELLSELGQIEPKIDIWKAKSKAQKDLFWEYRRRISESISKPYHVHKNDISVPLVDMEVFLHRLQDLIKKEYNTVDAIFFGHVGDGNIHLNLIKVDSEMDDDDFLELCSRFDAASYSLINDFKGSISAEHGIGLLKRQFLNYSRSTEEIEIMRSIKDAFDPAGIMNPGKIFPERVARQQRRSSAASADPRDTEAAKVAPRDASDWKGELYRLNGIYRKRVSSGRSSPSEILKIQNAIEDAKKEHLISLELEDAPESPSRHDTKILLSYAWKDNDQKINGTGRIDAIVQGLRDRGLNVLRDVELMRTGHRLFHEWARHLPEASKVLILGSQNWSLRSMTENELDAAQFEEDRRREVSKKNGVSPERLLLFCMLDSSKPPKRYLDRSYIAAMGQSFNEVIEEIYQAIGDTRAGIAKYDTSPYEDPKFRF